MATPQAARQLQRNVPPPPPPPPRSQSDAGRPALRAAVQPRRALLAGLLSAGVAAAHTPLAAGSASPYDDVLPEVGLVNGRLRSCPSTFNCISTSSKSSDQYASPWIATASSAAAAAEAIVAAVAAVCPGSELVASEATPSGQYLRFHAKGKFELPDELEFLVRSYDGGRNWEGDADGGWLVTLRSIAGTVQFVYPFMTPVSDGGLQKKRATLIREQLAWRLVGCELIECYS